MSSAVDHQRHPIVEPRDDGHSFPLAFFRWLLAGIFSQDMQHRADHAADSLGSHATGKNAVDCETGQAFMRTPLK